MDIHSDDSADESDGAVLPADAVVDLAAARREAGVDDVLTKLDTE